MAEVAPSSDRVHYCNDAAERHRRPSGDRQGTVTRITAAPRFRAEALPPDPDGEADAEAPTAEVSAPADTEAYTRAASQSTASQLTVAIPASKALDDAYMDQLLAGEAASPRAEAATSSPEHADPVSSDPLDVYFDALSTRAPHAASTQTAALGSATLSSAAPVRPTRRQRTTKSDLRLTAHRRTPASLALGTIALTGALTLIVVLATASGTPTRHVAARTASSASAGKPQPISFANRARTPSRAHARRTVPRRTKRPSVRHPNQRATHPPSAAHATSARSAPLAAPPSTPAPVYHPPARIAQPISNPTPATPPAPTRPATPPARQGPSHVWGRGLLGPGNGTG